MYCRMMDNGAPPQLLARLPKKSSSVNIPAFAINLFIVHTPGFINQWGCQVNVSASFVAVTGGGNCIYYVCSCAQMYAHNYDGGRINNQVWFFRYFLVLSWLFCGPDCTRKWRHDNVIFKARFGSARDIETISSGLLAIKFRCGLTPAKW